MYEVKRTEKLSAGKFIALLDVRSGRVVSGDAARKALGLSTEDEATVGPESAPAGKVLFVHSNAANRKLVIRHRVFLWGASGVGVVTGIPSDDEDDSGGSTCGSAGAGAGSGAKAGADPDASSAGLARGSVNGVQFVSIGDDEAAAVVVADKDCTLREATESAGVVSAEGIDLYEVVKSENVSAQKLVALWDPASGRVVSGDDARREVGLPGEGGGSGRVNKSSAPAGKVLFVQSTSAARKVKKGQRILVWNIPRPAETPVNAGAGAGSGAAPSGRAQEGANDVQFVSIGDDEAAAVVVADKDCTLREATGSAGVVSAEGIDLYEVVKSENVSAQKLVALWDPASGRVVSGDDARREVGLPGEGGGSGRVNKSSAPAGKVLFVQSTSAARKVKKGQRILVWNIPRPAETPVNAGAGAGSGAAPSGRAQEGANDVQYVSIGDDKAAAIVVADKHCKLREATGPYGVVSAEGIDLYEVVKSEEVSKEKLVALWQPASGAVLGDTAARSLLGLPIGGWEVRVNKSTAPEGYVLFVQSTSAARKVKPGQRILVWNVPKPTGLVLAAPVHATNVVARVAPPTAPQPQGGAQFVPLEDGKTGALIVVDRPCKLQDVGGMHGISLLSGVTMFEVLRSEPLSWCTRILLWDPATREITDNVESRKLLNLESRVLARPARVNKSTAPKGKVLFVQSQSSSRKVHPGQRVFIWNVVKPAAEAATAGAGESGDDARVEIERWDEACTAFSRAAECLITASARFSSSAPAALKCPVRFTAPRRRAFKLGCTSAPPFTDDVFVAVGKAAVRVTLPVDAALLSWSECVSISESEEVWRALGVEALAGPVTVSSDMVPAGFLLFVKATCVSEPSFPCITLARTGQHVPGPMVTAPPTRERMLGPSVPRISREDDEQDMDCGTGPCAAVVRSALTEYSSHLAFAGDCVVAAGKTCGMILVDVAGMRIAGHVGNVRVDGDVWQVLPNYGLAVDARTRRIATAAMTVNQDGEPEWSVLVMKSEDWLSASSRRQVPPLKPRIYVEGHQDERAEHRLQAEYASNIPCWTVPNTVLCGVVRLRDCKGPAADPVACAVGGIAFHPKSGEMFVLSSGWGSAILPPPADGQTGLLRPCVVREAGRTPTNISFGRARPHPAEAWPTFDLPVQHDMAVLPDSGHVVLCTGKTVAVLSARTGRFVSLHPLRFLGGYLQPLPDGRILFGKRDNSMMSEDDRTAVIARLPPPSDSAERLFVRYLQVFARRHNGDGCPPPSALFALPHRALITISTFLDTPLLSSRADLGPHADGKDEAGNAARMGPTEAGLDCTPAEIVSAAPCIDDLEMEQVAVAFDGEVCLLNSGCIAWKCKPSELQNEEPARIYHNRTDGGGPENDGGGMCYIPHLKAIMVSSDTALPPLDTEFDDGELDDSDRHTEATFRVQEVAAIMAE